MLEEDVGFSWVFRDEWVQLGRGKGENVPSGREARGKGGEGGMAVGCHEDWGGNGGCVYQGGDKRRPD